MSARLTFVLAVLAASAISVAPLGAGDGPAVIVVAETPAEPETPPMGGGAGGGGGAAELIKYDCKIIGPNESAGGGSADPKVKFKCVDIGDNKMECCFYKRP
jgi:hypothetical protein